MNTYSGILANPGLAIGKLYYMDKTEISIVRKTCSDTEIEIKRLEEAFFAVITSLESVRDKVITTHGKDSAETLSAHILILSDKDKKSILGRSIEYIKTNEVNAEYAVKIAGSSIAAEFASSSSDYLSARSEDIEHLTKMILAKLTGQNHTTNEMPNEPFVLAAIELSPEDLISINPKLILGIVTKKGSVLSHTAILAGNLNVPYLTNVKFDNLVSGSLVAIDGESKEFIVEPDESTIHKLNESIKETKDKVSLDLTNAEELVKNCPIKLCANIGKPEEAYRAIENHAQGIGLFRSEFLYMDRECAPSEEEQYDAYVQVLDAMGGKPVTIRTIDIGADKLTKCVALPNEENPALGTRGIRISFANPEIFESQLRALLRAAYGRNLRIMFPMITSEWEVKKAIDEVKRIANQLENEGVQYSIPKIGIMVETPAAALTIDSFAPYIEFISIGTNDLTQYTLALDRVNDSLCEYLIPHHEAILKLIRIITETAHKYDIEVGICGELGSDVNLLSDFAKLKIDEISMSSGKIISVASKLGEFKSSDLSMNIVSPIKGYIVPMKDIPDETFAGGLLGPCVGILPDDGTIFSPCDGKISMVAKSLHAFSIKRDLGDEVLVHVGIDTVKLDGRGFFNELKVGQRVTAGEKLMSFDMKLIIESGFSPMVVVVKLESN